MIFLTLIFAVACGDAQPDVDGPTATAVSGTEAATPTAVPTLVEVGSAGATPSPAVTAAVMLDLARRLSAPASGITVISLEPMTWPNSCLGLNGPGQSCAAALVPGWLAVLRGPDGKEYRYRGAGDRFLPEP